MNTFNLAAPSIDASSFVTGTTSAVHASTEAQLEIWLSSNQSTESNCAYNEISSLDLNGTFDSHAIQTAIQHVIQRNESLRSTFSDDGRSVIVHEYSELDFKLFDWSKLDPGLQQNHHDELIRKEGSTPFDLVNGPLIRFVLANLGPDHHRLTFNAHHIVMDGWSLALFCRDLGYFYDREVGKEPSPLPPVVQYKAYAEAMEAYGKSDQCRDDEKFWIDQFADGIPVLDSPIEFSRPTLKTYRSERYEHRIDAFLSEKVRQVGAKQGCSLFNTMLAAFNAYLGRLTGADDLCVGIPTAGQAAMDTQDLIGFCVNTMPFRSKVDASASFEQLLTSTRKTLLDAFEHQRLSFGTLLRLLAPPRDPSRSPIVDVSFNLDPVVDLSQAGFSDLDVSVCVEPRCFEKFEWFINGVIHQDKSIELQIQYNADLYSRNAIEFYFQGFSAFLEGVVADPAKRVSDYHLMSIEQRQQVVVDWNQTNLDYPVNSTLHQEFSRQAAETPEHIAVEFEGSRLTYSEVESQSNRIARFLKDRGVRAGDLVGICVERSEQMLVNLLGILKSGAGYVPLDPAYPSDRLKYMCDHSELSLIITQGRLRERVAEFGKEFVEIDRCSDDIDTFDDAAVQVQSDPSDICYVIYTSGSTGKPKGVQVPHGAIVNFLYSMQKEPGFNAEDSILAVTTLSFDIAVLELYLPIVSGGKVVILDSATAADGGELAQRIGRHEISLLQATPSTWRLLIQAGWNGKTDLKVLCGGEPMPQDLVAPLLERCAELWNMYGPTETTVWSAIYRIADAKAPILIGKPIGNTQVYLLDCNGNEVPPGCEGQLFIGGAGVTLGYRARHDLTEDRFIRNPYRSPFKDYVSDRIYNTGDIAKYRFDGNLEFLRRNDKQVKVRGFRIELGEIEQTLKTHPAVEQNVVIVREDSPGDSKLVAYWIAKSDQECNASDFRTHLRASLPGYMIPHHFVQLDQMPQTNNGKIDYKQLPKPSADSTSDKPSTEDQALTSAEVYFIDACSNALEHRDILLDDTFFDVGGHSLLVMELIARVEKEIGIKLGPQDFLVNTIRQLAEKLESANQFSRCAESHDNCVADEVSRDPNTSEGAGQRRIEPIRGFEPDHSPHAATLPDTFAASPQPSHDLSKSCMENRESFLKKLRGFWD
ncbi:MAG: amino acid adenylation domain-containing protein [Planctomycetota bacterium]